MTNSSRLQQQTPASPDSLISPAPLNVTPSRARNKFAERLALRAKEAAEEENATLQATDPDTADAAAVQRAFEMPVEPLSDLPDLDLSAVTERQINELMGNTGASGEQQGRVVSAYSSSSSSLDSASSSDEDEDPVMPNDDVQGEGQGIVGVKRRPSTTEAKKRVPLDDGEEDEQQHRPQVQRMISDPFASPAESSGDDSSESSGDELSFGG